MSVVESAIEIRRYSACIYLFKFNKGNTGRKVEICLTSRKKKTLNDVNDVVLVFLLLPLNIFHTFFYRFYS